MKDNSNSITFKIIGGLGNQLFGYFFGLAVANRLKTPLTIDGSLIKFGSNKTRVANVHNFVISNEKVFFASLRDKYLKFFVSNRYFRKLYWVIVSKFSPNLTEDHVKAQGFKFEINKSYTGYFQNWFYADYYFAKNAGASFDLIEKSKKYLETYEKMRELNPICVHLRIGDYLNFPEVYGIIPTQYFTYCISLLREESINRPVWLFIESRSDLSLFYKDLLTGYIEIFDQDSGLTDSETFMLLCNSKSLVATNSTFSLWAAWFVWKKGNKAYIPFSSYINSESNLLMDERWDRYDFENDIFYPGKFNQERYDVLEKEFLSKFA